jgi:undecaprenyl-diphosphatase
VSVVQAIIIGLVQGATEFLPVSSSGHLVLVPWWLGWDDPGLTYDTVVHLGSLVALVFYFRRQIMQLLSGWWHSVRTRSLATDQAHLSWLVIASARPGTLIGYFGESFFRRILGSPRDVSLLLLGTGALLLAGERVGRKTGSLRAMNLGHALVIGLVQGCAIAPGLSRSGATIAAGLMLGLRRDEAARFSFLMSIPIIAGAAGVQVLKDAFAGLIMGQIPQLAAGFLAALLAGYVAIRFLLDYVCRHSLRPFAYYCWAISLAGPATSLLPRWT